MKRPPITTGHWRINPRKSVCTVTNDMHVPLADCVPLEPGGYDERDFNAIAIASLPQLLEALEEIVKADEDATKALKEIYGIQPNEGALRLQSMARAALIAAGYTED